MIKHLTILIVLCSIALGISVLGTIYFTIRGNFPYMGVAAVCSVLFFCCLVVLLKEQRIARIMHEDNYDEEHEPL